jgi:hypothetical protein
MRVLEGRATKVDRRGWMDLVLGEGRREYLLDDEEWGAIYRQVTGYKEAEPRWMEKEAVLLHELYADGMEPWQVLKVVAAACNWPTERDA